MLRLAARLARPSSMERRLSKLPRVPPEIRRALKVRHIKTCDELLAVAARLDNRLSLARAARISPETLTEVVRRADLARVCGTGFVFSQMLMEVGVLDVAVLAEREATMLHKQLQHYNSVARMARRSPTAAEVVDWIQQARKLPRLITYGPPVQAREAIRTQSWDAH